MTPDQDAANMTTETDEQAALRIRRELDARDNSNTTDEELCLEYARRLLAWERAKQDGMMIVPMEPTPDMMLAAVDIVHEEGGCAFYDQIYRAMLSAAPASQDAPAAPENDQPHFTLADSAEAERCRDAYRELLAMHNLGGMTDFNIGPMKRALAAESRLAAVFEETREKIRSPLFQQFLKQGFWHAHYVDLKWRMDGKDVYEQADWLKDLWYFVRALEPPKEPTAAPKTAAEQDIPAANSDVGTPKSVAPALAAVHTHPILDTDDGSCIACQQEVSNKNEWYCAAHGELRCRRCREFYYAELNAAAAQEPETARTGPVLSPDDTPALAVAPDLCDKILEDMPPYYGESTPAAPTLGQFDQDAVNAKAEALRLEGMDHIDFYERKFYPLSNFSAFRLVWKGIDFDQSEIAYHWEKFHDHPELQKDLLACRSAHEAFKLAETYKTARRRDWDAVKVDIMRDILRAKADQHEYVRRKLLETGTRTLVECSWRDDFWGWGPNRDGQNILGKLWMEIRAEIARRKAELGKVK